MDQFGRQEQRQLQHVDLPTACSVIYIELTGHRPDARDPVAMQRILNDIAHAVSNIIPIYVADDDSKLPQPISQYQLLEGRFIHGAHVFQPKDGHPFDRLTVQRKDMQSAIAVLKRARITFARS